jgi:hypothetical protein
MENQEQPIIQPQMPVQPVTEPTKKSPPKWPLIIVGVILLATLLMGTYLLGKNQTVNQKPIAKTTIIVPTATPTPDPTAAWKIYTGKGFTFRYPVAWTLSSDTFIQAPPDTNCPHCAGGGAGIDITRIENPNSAKLSELAKTALNRFGRSNDFVAYSIPEIGDSIIDRTAYGAGAVQEAVAINAGKFVVVLDCLSSDCTDNNLFDKILSTFKFTDQISQTNNIMPTPAAQSPTPDLFASWSTYSDSKYNYSFKFPADWTAQAKDYQENNQRLVNIIKNSSPSVVSLSFTISNSWANTGDAQYQPKNYSVGGVSAYRIDPPTKAERQLDRYQTNVYFENKGYVYTFVCTHNWDQDYINTCNNLLSTFKFTQ